MTEHERLLSDAVKHLCKGIVLAERLIDSAKFESNEELNLYTKWYVSFSEDALVFLEDNSLIGDKDD